MCQILTARKLSHTPATEEVVFNRREERRDSAVDRFMAKVFTVEASFDRLPAPGQILEAQARAGLPFPKHAVFPETVTSKTAGGVTTVTWKVRA